MFEQARGKNYNKATPLYTHSPTLGFVFVPGHFPTTTEEVEEGQNEATLCTKEKNAEI
jgi:hypothetical protein